MKKIIIFVLAVVLFNACGPSLEQQKKLKRINDSIAEINRVNDSINKALNEPDKVGIFKDAKMTNSKMYSYSGTAGLMLYPDDGNDSIRYKYMRGKLWFPLLEFLFIYDEPSIKKLSVNDLKSCEMPKNFIYKIPFSSLPGCEELAKAIPTYNEFTLLEKKDEIIKTIINSYNNILNEYKNSYLTGFKGNGTYQFREIDTYDLVSKSSYNFDTKKLKMGILNITSSGYSCSWGWTYRRLKFDDAMTCNDKMINEFEIDLPLDQAKILFGDSIDVYSETVVTVKPKFGFFVEHYLFTDFDILYVTKNYYKANTWDDQSKSYSGEPILSIRIFSNKIHPLHP